MERGFLARLASWTPSRRKRSSGGRSPGATRPSASAAGARPTPENGEAQRSPAALHRHPRRLGHAARRADPLRARRPRQGGTTRGRPDRGRGRGKQPATGRPPRVRHHGHRGTDEHIWLGTGKLFDSFNFFFEPTEAGWIWAYAYQHEPRASTFIVECEPQTWSGLGFDNCSPTRTLGRLEEIFSAHLLGHRLWSEFAGGEDARWRNFLTVSNRRWHHGNVVLVGDSAHTAHFSAGLGSTLAIGDAIALAAQLRAPAPRGRRRRRRPDGRPGGVPAAAPGRATTRLARAQRSAAWFENVPRHAELPPRQFTTALHARSAPLPPGFAAAVRSAARRPQAVRHRRRARSLAGR